MSTIKYQYLRPRTPNTKLCIGIATELFKTDVGVILDFAVTFKNPNDQFSKEIAREVLENNLNTGYSAGKLYLGPNYTHNEIVLKILMSLYINDVSVPHTYHSFIECLIWEYL